MTKRHKFHFRTLLIFISFLTISLPISFQLNAASQLAPLSKSNEEVHPTSKRKQKRQRKNEDRKKRKGKERAKKWESFKNGYGKEIPPHLLSSQEPSDWISPDLPKSGEYLNSPKLARLELLPATDESKVIKILDEAYKKSGLKQEISVPYLKTKNWKKLFGEKSELVKKIVFNPKIHERFSKKRVHDASFQTMSEIAQETIDAYKPRLEKGEISLPQAIKELELEHVLLGPDSLVLLRSVPHKNHWRDLDEVLNSLKTKLKEEPDNKALKAVIEENESFALNAKIKRDSRAETSRSLEKSLEKIVEDYPVLTDEMITQAAPSFDNVLALMKLVGTPDIVFPLRINEDPNKETIPNNWMDAKQGLELSWDLARPGNYDKFLKRLILYTTHLGKGALVFPHYPFCAKLLDDVKAATGVTIEIFILPQEAAIAEEKNGEGGGGGGGKK